MLRREDLAGLPLGSRCLRAPQVDDQPAWRREGRRRRGEERMEGFVVSRPWRGQRWRGVCGAACVRSRQFATVAPASLSFCQTKICL